MRARKCAFLGFKPHMKGVVLFDVIRKQVLISRRVTFQESIFPYKAVADVTQLQCWEPTFPSTLVPYIPPHPPLTNPNHTTESNLEPDTNPADPEPHPNPDIDPNTALDTNSSPNLDPNLVNPPPPLRKSTRQHKSPTYLQDYLCNSTTSSPSYPIHNYISYANLSSSHKAYTMAIDIIPEPATYKEASKHPCWVDATNKELEALTANHTWTIVTKPEGGHSHWLQVGI